MQRIIQIKLKKDRKCPSCNWNFSRLYHFGTNPVSDAICANCFMEMMIECGMRVTLTKLAIEKYKNRGELGE